MFHREFPVNVPDDKSVAQAVKDALETLKGINASPPKKVEEAVSKEPDKVASDLAVAQARIKELEKELVESKKQVAGLESWIESRKKTGVEVFNIGDSVYLNRNLGKPVAVCVEKVYITRNGVQYKVSWWNGDEYRCVKLCARELTADYKGDTLAVPKYDYKVWADALDRKSRGGL